MMWRLVAFILLASPLPTAALAGEAPVAVFILAGQSNMSGRGALADLPPSIQAGSDGVLAWRGADGWTRAAEPVDAPRPEQGPSQDADAGVGPGLSFGLAILDRMGGAQVGLVPCALGATSIADWAPAASPRSLYGACLAQARTALAARPGSRLAGLLWYQGEWDARRAEDAAAWDAAFTALITAFRADLGQPGLPVVYARLAGLDPSLCRRFPAWDRVRQAQAQVHLADAALVDLDEASLKDGIHLDTRGQVIAGMRFADAMAGLLATPQVRPGPVPSRAVCAGGSGGSPAAPTPR
ncbi:sialate O-acetylesterase [Zavarzinia sp. CC-PAN008]|uniref:sialate O-acetylesterase n=1 Tax=Zavarzinia sp. CC-PAN008 TaxID=3243332 RepID=UPI003F747EC2